MILYDNHVVIQYMMSSYDKLTVCLKGPTGRRHKKQTHQVHRQFYMKKMHLLTLLIISILKLE